MIRENARDAALCDVDRFTWERGLRHPDVMLKPATAGLMYALAQFLDADTGITFVGQEKLHVAARMSTRGVRRHLKLAIEEAKVLQRTARGHRLGDGRCLASVYQAVLPKAVAHDPEVARSTGQEPRVESSQPDSGGISTGHGCPPINRDQSVTRANGSTGQKEPIELACEYFLSRKGVTEDEIVGQFDRIDHLDDALISQALIHAREKRLWPREFADHALSLAGAQKPARCNTCGANGWLGLDVQGTPIPCPECKPSTNGHRRATAHDLAS